MRALFADDANVVVPSIHHAHSTRRVLVMELVGGIKVTEKAALVAAGIDPADVVQDLMRVYVRMIMAEGFFQADPHPGNLFVHARPASSILLDFGLSKELPEGFGLGLFELMFSMMTQNESAMIRAFRELGFETKTGDTSTFLLIARRMIGAQRDGRLRGRVHRGDDRRAVRGDPREPDRAGAERLRAGRRACSRSSPASRTRSAARERARRDGRRGPPG